ncbi:hypothetical protein CDAR_487651 [Caerostris darwini]|uniref:Uncharacterized protein n=1 Tax=Caerostris darwini TaxID=1538125 RepID=A0AAV4PU01_9ARAC|nr:hypothetical protein CDAR_487651 [Caerostris darwini]
MAVLNSSFPVPRLALKKDHFNKRTPSHTYQPSQRDKGSRSSERHAQSSAFGHPIRYLTTLQRGGKQLPHTGHRPFVRVIDWFSWGYQSFQWASAP